MRAAGSGCCLSILSPTWRDAYAWEKWLANKFLLAQIVESYEWCGKWRQEPPKIKIISHECKNQSLCIKTFKSPAIFRHGQISNITHFLFPRLLPSSRAGHTWYILRLVLCTRVQILPTFQHVFLSILRLCHRWLSQEVCYPGHPVLPFILLNNHLNFTLSQVQHADTLFDTVPRHPLPLQVSMATPQLLLLSSTSLLSVSRPTSPDLPRRSSIVTDPPNKLFSPILLRCRHASATSKPLWRPTRSDHL
jgi:hypothetical protein